MWADPNIVTPTISGDLSFTESTTVTMECTSPNSDIYYTTDGVTDPRCDCAAAPEYKHPITITETTIIKAAAFDGDDWSAVAEVTFTKKAPEPDMEYYLVGSINGWNALTTDESLKLTANPAADGEYMIDYTFEANDDFKVVGRPEGSQDITWFPTGMENNYVITEAGNYTVYFRPDGQGGEDWHYGCIYAVKNEPQVQVDETVIYVAFPSANRPENIEVAGTFEAGAWGMRVFNGDWYTCNEDLYTSAEDTLKFRDADNHDIVLCQRIPANGEGEDKWVQLLLKCSDFEVVSWKGEMVRVIEEQDFSNATDFAWKEGMPEPSPEGIENIVLTEQAQKMVVDGVLYIIRDNKLYNVQGVQVK